MFTRDSKILSHRLTTPLTSVANAVGDVFKPTYNQIIKSLFANGEQGFFYDPNDLSTMFQDAAGTVPVTGAGQPVGLMLDKSKGLVLGNELITNGNFSNGLTGWSVQNGTGVIVNGAARLTATSTAQVQLFLQTGFLAGKHVEISVDFMNRTGGTGVFVGFYSETLGSVASITSTETSGVVKFRCMIPSNFNGGLYCRLNTPTAGSYIDFDNISVKELAGNHAYQTDAASRPLLQRNATTGAYYLAFDGSDDFLQTANIDFTATDKISLFAGVRKLSDAATGIVCELSSSLIANNGTFYLLAPTSYGIDSVGFTSKGTVASGANATGYVSPASSVITGQSSIRTPLSRLRVNGVTKLTNTASQGTGNYGNYPLYIGRRAGTSLPFNGHIYGLIGIGKLTSDNETAAIEKELAKRVGVTLS